MDETDLTSAAAQILDAAMAEPVPEKLMQLAKQLEKTLADAKAPAQSSDAGS